MRIGIEAQRILRKNKHGMDMVALQLIKALQEIAPEHEYVVFVRPGEDTGVLNGLSSVKFVYVRGITYADWEQVWLPLAILREKVDLMHFTSNTAPVFCPVPYILTLHDVIFMEKSSRSKVLYQRLGAIYREWNVPIAVRKAAKVVTVSNYESNRILKYFPDVNHQLRVIYNAVSSSFFDRLAMPASSSLGKIPSSFFLFLGNTDPKKNTDNVIKAYIHYRQTLKGDLPLIIGDYPRALVEALMVKEGAGYLLEDVVSMGYLTQFELSNLYKKATAFLYPSLRESFGIPLLEAMACHCPVISSNTSSMPEVAEGAAILIDPTNPLEIGNAMADIERDFKLREKLILKGIDRASQFSWSRSAQQYSRLYEEVSLSRMLNKLSIQNL
jgi:glycosyltransferase involved in cell wall biosynthesis